MERYVRLYYSTLSSLGRVEASHYVLAALFLSRGAEEHATVIQASRLVKGILASWSFPTKYWPPKTSNHALFRPFLASCAHSTFTHSTQTQHQLLTCLSRTYSAEAPTGQQCWPAYIFQACSNLKSYTESLRATRLSSSSRDIQERSLISNTTTSAMTHVPSRHMRGKSLEPVFQTSLETLTTSPEHIMNFVPPFSSLKRLRNVEIKIEELVTHSGNANFAALEGAPSCS